MLGDADAMATVAVRDAQASRGFYEGILGLGVQTFDASSGVAVYRAGASKVVVYVSEFAGTGGATAVTWDLGEQLEAVVEALQTKGVAFERYEMDGVEHRGPIHAFGNFRAAWFKDPDGNILHVNSG
jgi:catechol 2,3-dioxygenase-like lactoylglutathione lyase family enzyme